MAPSLTARHAEGRRLSHTERSGAQLGRTGQALTATALNPVSGGWTLVVAFAEPVAGTEVSDPYTGSVTFAPAGTAGATVAGTLYLDALQGGVPPYGQLAGDEVAALPYSYKVGG